MLMPEFIYVGTYDPTGDIPERCVVRRDEAAQVCLGSIIEYVSDKGPRRPALVSKQEDL